MRSKMKKGVAIGIGLLGLAMAGCADQSGENGRQVESAVESSQGTKNTGTEMVTNEKTVLTATGTTEENSLNETDGTAIYMENPSWDYYNAQENDPSTPSAAPLTVVKLTEQPNEIMDTKEWFERNHLDRELETADIADEGKKEKYSCEILSGADKGGAFCIQVADTETNSSYILDFENYRYSNDSNQKDANFVEQSIRYAQVKDGILYFSIGNRTYTPHNAYVAAVDLASRKLLWKSRPLVSNANNFIIKGNILLCGYGFTDEPDYLYQLDLADGRVIAQIPLKSKADYLILKEGILYVRTYKTDYTFQIQ